MPHDAHGSPETARQLTRAVQLATVYRSAANVCRVEYDACSPHDHKARAHWFGAYTRNAQQAAYYEATIREATNAA